MAADRLIDWSSPWLAPHADLRAAVESADWRTAMTAAAHANNIRTTNGLAVWFVAADDAPPGVAYEAHIAATGRVPSRDNLHDRFNALMWLAYPRTKAALNARQAAEIECHGVNATRGAVRDAATLIDESGLLLASADAAVFDLLAQRNWRTLLIERRSVWQRAIVPRVFGHALLEKLVGPYKAITAAVVPVTTGDAQAASIDAAAAAFVSRFDLAPRLLEHLPVLGIPGWCAANADPRFYDDERVFRPSRRAA